MITSLNQLLKYFENFATAHDMLNSFGYGATSEIGTTKQMEFPYLWVTHTGASSIAVQNKTAIPTMSLTFIVLDQCNDQENYKDAVGNNSSNAQEVLSDTFQTCQDILTYILNNLNKKGVKIPEGSSFSIEPIEDDTTDKAFGWKLDVNLEVTHFNCGIPGNFINL